MPKGIRNSLSITSVKRKGRPPKKKTRDSTGRVDEVDDFEYTGEESDQSFGEDEVDNLSDTDSVLRGKKRGRPKVSSAPLKDERSKRQPGTPTASSASPSLDTESDYDEIGETKVDRGGNLLGGRQYKVPTFNLPNRGHMLFMFSKDPAALLGFRDSFVFLKKNPKLVKVHVTDAEKGYLVQHNLLRSTFRTREVSVVTARSVFKQFGHRVLKKGRRGRDDYYYTGEIDDAEFADDHSEEETGKEGNEKSWSPFAVSGRNNLTSNSRRTNTTISNTSTKLSAAAAAAAVPVINETNWMHHVALSIRNFNTQLCEYRRDNPSFFDLHTNVHQIPSSKQPLRLLYEMTEKPIKKESIPQTTEDTDNSATAVAAGTTATNTTTTTTTEKQHALSTETAATRGTEPSSSTSASYTIKNSEGSLSTPAPPPSTSNINPTVTPAVATVQQQQRQPMNIPSTTVSSTSSVTHSVPTSAVVSTSTPTSVTPSSLPVSTPAGPQMGQVQVQQPGQFPTTSQQQQHAIRQMQAQQAAAAGHPMYFQQMAGNRPPQAPMGGPMGGGAYHPQQQQQQQQQQMMMQHASNGGVYGVPNTSMAPVANNNPYAFMHPGGTM